jgi:hypothetical protein
LADMKMSILRMAAEGDISCNTRGKLVEWVLLQEFLSGGLTAI